MADDLYERLRRIREHGNRRERPDLSEPTVHGASPVRHAGSRVGSHAPGPDWERLEDGVYRRRRSFAIPHRWTPQIDRSGAWRNLSSVLRIDDPVRPLFLDVETSGLSAGSGSVAFLVGLGTFRRNELVSGAGADRPDHEPVLLEVHQVFLSDLGAEAAYTGALHRLIERAAEAASSPLLYVTYNGASFDLPVLRTRAIMNRRFFPEHHHLDLLPVTRRLFSSRLESCRLGTVERDVLQCRRDRDIPGSEVPERYLSFLRTGDVSGLQDVTDHHYYDIAHLALLGLRLNEILLAAGRHESEVGDTGDVRDNLPEADRYALIRLLLERGSPAERTSAKELLRHLVWNGRNGGRAELVRRSGGERWLQLARLYARTVRREQRWSELRAILRAIWEHRGDAQDAVELAKQLEHRDRDFTEALRIVTDAGERRGWDEALQHRAHRLRRRIRRDVERGGPAVSGSDSGRAPRTSGPIGTS